MEELNQQNSEYHNWLTEWKKRIQSAQIKAAMNVNSELLNLYWELGHDIVTKQEKSEWGDGLIPRFSKDLKNAFPYMKGFSRTNLFYIRKWFLFYKNSISIAQQAAGQLQNPQNQIVQQVAGQLQNVDNELLTVFFTIPWGHHQVILDKSSDISEAIFYLKKTLQNNWSRDVLKLEMKQNLFSRQGKAITNFEKTLPKYQSDLAVETLKNPYNFDFLNMGEEALERDIEQAMMQHVEKVLLELGQGFALVGRQFKITVEEKDYFIDLLFYHTLLHAYVVVDLKGGTFKPEYAGKLNFYCSAVDDLIRTKPDQSTIGLILCRETGKQTIVEYALRNIQTPIGVTEFALTQILPENLKNILPTTEQLERELDDNFEK
jgi:predicted nuclease of restriction endonuclease-like (RecB) superfamily